MRRQGATLVAVSVFAGAALIASCAKPYHEETERYVFLATNINLPYWREAQAGFLDAARTLGVKGELTGPTTYDPNGEVGMFRQIVPDVDRDQSCDNSPSRLGDTMVAQWRLAGMPEVLSPSFMAP